MKQPENTPNLNELTKQNSDGMERLFELLETRVIGIGDDYFHWEQLADQVLPSYLSLREWWFLLKMQRLVGRVEIDLKDRQERPFTMGSVEFFAKTLHQLDRSGDESKENEDSGILSDHLAVEALREEAIASSQLDGAATDTGAARELLRSGRKPRDQHERMIWNNFRALERVREIRGQPLTLALLSDLHQRLTAGTRSRADLSGRLRRTGEHAPAEGLEGRLVREPPPAAELPARLKAMLALANGRAPAQFLHPLLRAVALHFWVVYDQPFADANGRLARALFYWSALNAGYGIFDHLAPSAALRDAPAQYLRAFQFVETDDNDLTHLAAHLFKAIARAQRQLHEHARRQRQAIREMDQQLDPAWALNDRQRALIAQALAEPRRRTVLQEHARDHRLSRQTARNDFTPLVRLGLFEETKIGKALAFFPAADLAGRISNFKAKNAKTTQEI